MKKKYTVYEIEKLTNGRITKYKLNKAIEDQILPAETVKSTKKGRGVPKYFVFEDDLNEYLNKVGAERSKRIHIPGEEIEEEKQSINADISQNITKEINNQLIEIEKLKAKINILENNTHPSATNQHTNKYFLLILVLFSLLYISVFLYISSQ